MHKAILQYILLVGLPVLGVLALLQVGKNIQPPVSVAGTWNIESINSSQESQSCVGLSTWSDDPQLSITQSGRHLELAFNDDGETNLIGKMQGMSFIARQNPNLDEDPGTQLTAELDRQAEPDRLSIVMSSSQCIAVQSMTAVRQVDSSSMISGH